LGGWDGSDVALNGGAFEHVFVKDQLSIKEKGCKIRRGLLLDWLERRSDAENRCGRYQSGDRIGAYLCNRLVKREKKKSSDRAKIEGKELIEFK
jgi:hypothetical protein